MQTLGQRDNEIFNAPRSGHPERRLAGGFPKGSPKKLWPGGPSPYPPAPMSHPVADYFNDLHQSLGVGVPETSGYPALRNLLNAVGDTLKPKINAVIHPSNQGAGIPDGGLFSAKELKKHGPDSPSLFQLKPERGVIEVKPLDKDLSAFHASYSHEARARSTISDRSGGAAPPLAARAACSFGKGDGK